MSREEYRDTLECCREAADSVANAPTAEARNAAVNMIRLRFELARELYKLSVEEKEEKEEEEEMRRFKERLKEQIAAYEEASRSCAAREADYIKKLTS